MKKLISLCFLLFPIIGFSQNFNWEAALQKPDKTGFYRITLNPKITTHLNKQITDIRITDSQNAEVPYLFQKEAPTYYSQLFHDEVIEKRIQKSCCTSITLYNKKRNKINNISLLIKNADVVKIASLYGSYDQKDIYILKQNFKLYNINNQKETSELKILDFPLSDYLYYTIKIDDSLSAPLNILKAGYYDTFRENGKYTPVPSPEFTKKDSTEKKTYIKIVFDKETLLDKLEFSVKGGPYFLRKATLYEPKERKTKKGKTEYYLKEISKTILSSVNENSIVLPSLKTKELLLVIENEDNPALTIDSITGFHLNRYMIAWLEKDKQYNLKFGNENSIAPKYDLNYFKDSIPSSIPELKYGAIVSLKKEEIKVGARVFTNQNIIWIAIGAVVLLLGTMSVKMVKETVGKKNQ
ncbi:MAG: hypothetical protein M3Q58_05590 [Bacteroidota bacterium]|nr:hypothetical protein [Bacteroidota bacterium]